MRIYTKETLMLRFSLISAYVVTSMCIGYYIVFVHFDIMYKLESNYLTADSDDWYGIVCFASELLLYVFVMVLSQIWICETCHKESDIHPGINIAFHSVVLTSFITFISRIVVFLTVLKIYVPIPIIILAQYLHDAAYYQLPMYPILMTMERLVATMRVKTYESSKTTKTVTSIVVVSWTYAIWMHFASAISQRAEVYFLSVYINCALLTATIVLMIYTYRKNIKLYQQTKIKTLTERYQTAENIRLLRAIFKMIVLNTIYNMILLAMSFSFRIKDPVLLVRIMPYIISTWNLIVAVGLFLTLIIFFSAVGILRKLRNFFHGHKTSTDPTKVVIKSVTGNVVPLTAEADDYFGQLKKAWK